MSDALVAGIDWSGLTPEVCYLAKDRIVKLPLPEEATAISVLFDPFRNVSNIGVGFPSIVQDLGRGEAIGVGDREITTETIVEQVLAAILRDLCRATDRPVAPPVLAVPASLSERRRAFIVECAVRAGFTEPILIDTCAAAAVADHAVRDASRTVLVYHVGYAGTEYSLIRAARGRTRVVDLRLGVRCSGELLDAMVIEAIILALRRERVFLGLRQFTPNRWLDLRELASAARCKLSRNADAEVELPPRLTGLSDRMKVHLDAGRFARHIAPVVGRTVEDMFALLEQHELQLDQVDAVLLVGEVARAATVFAQVNAAVEGRAQRMPADAVVRGATLHALQLAGCKLPAPASASREEFAEPVVRPAALEVPDPGDPVDEFAWVVGGSSPTPRSRKPLVPSPRRSREGRGDPLRTIREMLSAGQIEAARAAIETLGDEIMALRKELDGAGTDGSVALLEQARKLLQIGRYREAIGMAHQAYHKTPSDPAVLDGMMSVHRDAGRLLSRPEEYRTALEILHCAHMHDQTDRSIHQALAERHLLHAITMRNLNNVHLAREALELALSFDPKNPKALELRTRLDTEGELRS